MARFGLCIAMLMIGAGWGDAGCSPAADTGDLNKLGTVRVSIKGQTFELWIADDGEEQQRGLMHVTADQMSPLSDGSERGMLFVFDREQVLSFWMRNTIIPLDIAYLDTQGTVVTTHTMAPLDERIGQYSSTGPARYAIEVNAGVWKRIGLYAGDVIELPTDALKRRPVTP